MTTFSAQHFGMKAHIGVDAESGLVHTVVGTAANAHDVTQAGALLHGEETEVFADSGYRIEQVALVGGHKTWTHLRRYTNLRPEDVHKGPSKG